MKEAGRGLTTHGGGEKHANATSFQDQGKGQSRKWTVARGKSLLEHVREGGVMSEWARANGVHAWAPGCWSRNKRCKIGGVQFGTLWKEARAIAASSGVSSGSASRPASGSAGTIVSSWMALPVTCASSSVSSPPTRRSATVTLATFRNSSTWTWRSP